MELFRKTHFVGMDDSRHGESSAARKRITLDHIPDAVRNGPLRLSANRGNARQKVVAISTDCDPSVEAKVPVMIKARENPFRTERIESLLTFHPEWIGKSWEGILDRWDSLGRFVSVVGPHGSGKTTCLESLQSLLRTRGHHVQHVRVNSMRIDDLPVLEPDSVVLLDAAGLRRGRASSRVFGWARWQFWFELQNRIRRCAGLIETRHQRGLRPVLLRTHTTPDMLGRCIQMVHESDDFSDADVVRLFRRHRGNLRNALRECYDVASRGNGEARSSCSQYAPSHPRRAQVIASYLQR